jgi:putative ABC transport system substrate-binding protein
MKRRDFITLLGRAVAAWPLAARAQAQQPAKRIGILSELAPTTTAVGGFREDTWRRAFRQRGYVEGQNILFDFRYAEEKFERLPALVDEFIRAKADIIMTASTASAVAAKRATTTIPIITISSDPIGASLIESLARPGGNVTGLFVPWSDLTAKGLTSSPGRCC